MKKNLIRITAIFLAGALFTATCHLTGYASQVPTGPGSIVQFSGHEMLYLGNHDGRHYVISGVSSLVEDTENGQEKRRVRSVVLNSLEDTKRANGKTWFEELNASIALP